MKSLLVLIALVGPVTAEAVQPAVPTLNPLPVWLESLAGPPETIPPGMYADCEAMLHADDWAQGTCHFGRWRDGAGGYSWSESFELNGGESLLLSNGDWALEHGDYVVKDSVVCESHGDSVLMLTWSYRVGPRHHGGVGIARIVYLPFLIVDTIWHYVPRFVVANYGSSADSGWAFVSFADIGSMRYRDSVWFALVPGGSSEVSFRSVRFCPEGPYSGICGWVTDDGDADSLRWRFTVRQLQRGNIGFSSIQGMPLDSVDTLRTFHPGATLCNYGMTPESSYVALVFSDTAGVAYADTHPVLLCGGQRIDVRFLPVRFVVTGPHHAHLALLSGGDSVEWDFWVVAQLGVSEAGPDERQRAHVGASLARGVLLLASTPGRAALFNATGRDVMALSAGANDVSALEAGVYFVRGPRLGKRRVVLVR
jgi:hypothetical protein